MFLDNPITVDCTASGWLATVREHLDRGQEVNLVNFSAQVYRHICQTAANLRSFEFQADEFHRTGHFRKQLPSART